MARKKPETKGLSTKVKDLDETVHVALPLHLNTGHIYLAHGLATGALNGDKFSIMATGDGLYVMFADDPGFAAYNIQFKELLEVIAERRELRALSIMDIKHVCAKCDEEVGATDAEREAHKASCKGEA